jgi:glycosyltransferase involved in cell wall biosynthesis
VIEMRRDPAKPMDQHKTSSVNQPSLAAIVLTYNEEIHIARCLESVRRCCNEIFIIDSFSSDRTVEIARAYGATVLQNAFVTQATQFQWALGRINTKATWLLRVDADEIIEDDLADEIVTRLPKLENNVVGIHLNRKHIFLGRWIRHGGRYPLYLLRIWRRGFGRVEQTGMDEHILTWGGRTVKFCGGFCDNNLRDITFFVDKHNRYATREAAEAFLRRRNLLNMRENGSARLIGQPARKRFIKLSVYEKLPFPLGPFLYFQYRFLIQLGFLDGIEGLIYHVLQGFWYRFLVGAKLAELERAVPIGTDSESAFRKIASLTGLKFEWMGHLR